MSVQQKVSSGSAVTKVVKAALVLAVAVSAVFTWPVQSQAAGQAQPSVLRENAGSRRYGPFATLRRANEVAAYFRSLGYSASIFYGGTLGNRWYSVDVW